MNLQALGPRAAPAKDPHDAGIGDRGTMISLAGLGVWGLGCWGLGFRV